MNLARLERDESARDAIVLYDPEAATAEARTSERRWQQGTLLGLLDGVPVAVRETDIGAATVLEPTSVALLGTGMIGLGCSTSPALLRVREKDPSNEEARGHLLSWSVATR